MLLQSITANAFTFGEEITFDHGQYQPGSPTGKRLLAHELTHVGQQKRVGRRDWGALQLDSAHSAAEQEAETTERYGDTPGAVQSTLSSPALGIQRQAKPLDAQFVEHMKQMDDDVQHIIHKLDELHYSDNDKLEVLGILRRWVHTPNPEGHKSEGSWFLEEILSRLARRSTDVGIAGTQISSYYSLMFNHFDRLNELRQLRDKFAPRFRGDEGIEEMSWGGEFWKDVKKGTIEQQIYGYFQGMGEAGIGFAELIVTMLTHPLDFIKSIGQLPEAVQVFWKQRHELMNMFLNASPP